jgi:hypothetical protein
MAQPVTVYRWDDPGAPQLPNGKPSEIIDILTKCLVDGYGDKTPLGWTRPFYDATNQAVAFRNNIAAGGSGGYAKFFSNNNSDSSNTLMRITHAVSMTDINTLFRPGYVHAFQVQSATGASKMDKWALIGTPTAFYFFITRNDKPMSSPNEYNCTLFCGDFFSRITNDAARFIAVVDPTASADTATINSNASLDRLTLSSISASPLKIYDADGFDDWVNFSVIHQIGQLSGSTTLMNAPPTFAPILFPVLIWATGQYNLLPTTTDRLNTLLQDSVIRPLFRGVLPGLSVNLFAGWNAESWPKTLTLSNGEHWLLRNLSTGGGCRMMLNMVEWHDPFNPV